MVGVEGGGGVRFYTLRPDVGHIAGIAVLFFAHAAHALAARCSSDVPACS